MPAVINFKICDNAPECSGVEVCPTKALHWDEVNETLIIDNKKCTACGACEKACPVGAIRVGKTEEEFEEILEEIKNDPRTRKELVVDKYGSVPIDANAIVDKNNFENEVIGNSRTNTVLVEFFVEDKIECLLHSIPFKDLLAGKCDVIFRKCNGGENKELMDKYKVTEAPSILVFRDGKEIGRIEGYYEDKKADELKKELDKIIS
ncbi:4Fe-4S binding protein [Candidatus Woesearchaeota archaeon]|nr:4Fe-4S binding protein [Candidatus Woesearchaeota archaeon]